MSRGRGTPRLTRKHLARAQRDRILSRWILGGAIVIGVAVFGLLAFAFFGVPIMEERQPIATINGEVVTVREFKARVRLIQLSMINEYQYAQNILQIYADEPSISAFYQQRIDQLTSELDNPGLQGQRALEGMINEILIRQEANSRGIFVTREEVDDAVAVKDFNYYAEGTPTPQPSPTPRPSPTAEPTPTADPTAQATSTPWPTPTEALAQASATPSSDAAPTSSPTPIPTPTPFTEDAFLAAYGVQMEFLTEIGILEDDYLALTEGELYRERLMAEVEQDLAREEDQVWLRHILVEDADEARGVLQRFADGETWEDLAAELSLDDLTKNDGGDLGWLASQDLAADYGDAFAIVAFATEIDDATGPIETEYGWHAIQILGHEVRPLSDFEFEQRLQDAFADLLADLMTEGELEVDEDWPDYIPHPSELARQVVE